MELLRSPEALAAWAADRVADGRIGLVPTMGYLHAGHASLMDALRPQCDHLVASIYVNPLQFGAGEDLDRYPRDEAGDLARCAAHGVDAVFLPTTMYPPGFVTTVTVSGLTARWCGESRPTHFAGVTTVCARLFGLSRCHVAAFGEKDWQQLQVIRRMVADLALPIEIVGAPIVREDDGLAMSSRNAYLTAEQRARAVTLSAALRGMQADAAAGERSTEALVDAARARIDCDRLDYLAVVDADLNPIARLDAEARVLAAAFYGQTRLIDNVSLGA